MSAGDQDYRIQNVDPALIEKYNKVYAEGEEKFWTFDSKNEQDCILRNVDFKGKSVLEIGCGTGDMAARIAKHAAHVWAIDASNQAIIQARGEYPSHKIDFMNSTLEQFSEQFMLKTNSKYWPWVDVVVMIGVLEHADNPEQMLKTIIDRHMASGSILASTSPLFLNPRGYVWVALQKLFGAPVSLTDKHVIDPWQMRKWAVQNNCELVSVKSVDQSWGCGAGMVHDWRQRLPKVFPDMNPNRITDFCDWLEAGIPWHKGFGANAVYFMRKL